MCKYEQIMKPHRVLEKYFEVYGHWSGGPNNPRGWGKKGSFIF